MRPIIIFTCLLVSVCFSSLVTVDINGGGDYLTIQEGVNNTIVGGQDTLEICEGVYVENVDFSSWVGFTGNDSIVVKACSGDEHRGDSSVGVKIQMSLPFNYEPDVAWVVSWFDIIFEVNKIGGGDTFNGRLSNYFRCMFFLTSDGATTLFLDGQFAYLRDYVVVCSATVAVSNQTCLRGHPLAPQSNGVVIMGGTRFGISSAISYNTVVKITPNSGAVTCYSGPNAASDHNACIKDGAASGADTTAPGANSFTTTLADVGFIDESQDDYHITSSSILFNAGLDRSSDFTLDIDLQTWIQWSIGVDQAPANPISLVWPNVSNNKVSNDSGRIPVLGNYAGTPDSLEARYDGGPWFTFDDSPENGSFSGNFYTDRSDTTWLVIRQQPNTAAIDSAQVYVGEKRFFGGQSNAMGVGDSAWEYTGTQPGFLYTSDVGWGPILNPVQPGATTNSILPLLASTIADTRPDTVPQIWIYYGRARGCVNNAPTQSTEAICPDTGAGNRLAYDSILIVNNDANSTGSYRDLFFFQGESDATQLSPGAKYQLWKDHLLDSLRLQLSSPDMVGFLGYIGYRVADSINPIRVAQQNLGALGNWSFTTPTYDVDYSVANGGDGAHFVTAEEQQIQHDRMYRGYASFYGLPGGDGRAPVLSSASIPSNGSMQITLTFTTGPGFTVSNINSNIFTVVADTGEVSVTSADVSTANTVILTMSEGMDSLAVVSIAKDNDGVGTDFLDVGTFPAPPEVILNQPIIIVAPAPSGGNRNRGGIIRFIWLK